MEILIKDQLASAERDLLFSWSDQVFPIEGRAFTWAAPQKHIVVMDNDNPVAHLGFGVYDLEVNGFPQKSVGVGGVVVRPEYQKNNIPRLMFETLHSMQEFIEQAFCFSLFCPERLTSYYMRHGYSLVSEPVQFIQRDKYVDSGTAKFMAKGLVNSGDVRILGEPW